MLNKLKNLFAKDPAQSHSPLKDEFDHSAASAKDASQCPIMSKPSQNKPGDAKKCPVSGKGAPNSAVDSDSEEEKPKGGCPFMGGASTKKKNPDLTLTESGYDEPFVSKFKYYLSGAKVDFSLKKGPLPPVSRDVFNGYPIYLQHTLFFNGEDYRKVRELECCSRFMAYEQLREKGNKRFNQGRFYEALDFYERAMSLFRWLQHQEPLSESTLFSENNQGERSFDEGSENCSNVNIELGEERATMEDSTAAFDELKSKYKEFFITYSDDNIKEFDGGDMSEAADVDMRKSLLIQIYLNMCAVYIHTHHYALALKVCEEGLDLSDNVSQLYFRKAQAIALSRNSSASQLQEALKCANIAVAKRSHEKIFATTNENILKMLNLQNAREAYQSCRQLVEERIREVTLVDSLNYVRVQERTKEIHEVEQRIIAEGKVPKERNDEPMLYNTTEMRIIDRMATKYQKVVEFYTESKNPEQVSLAKKQFQEVLRIKTEVKALLEVKLTQEGNELGGLGSAKIQARVGYVKTSFAENIYNAGKFNFTMLEWAIKEIVKEQGEERKCEEEERKREEKAKLSAAGQGVAGGLAVASEKGYGKLGYLLGAVPLLLILLSMYAQ